MQSLLFSRRKSARLLSISIRKLDSLIKTKLLHGVRIGKRVLVPHAELERFASRGTGAKARGGRNGK